MTQLFSDVVEVSSYKKCLMTPVSSFVSMDPTILKFYHTVCVIVQEATKPLFLFTLTQRHFCDQHGAVIRV